MLLYNASGPLDIPLRQNLSSFSLFASTFPLCIKAPQSGIMSANLTINHMIQNSHSTLHTLTVHVVEGASDRTTCTVSVSMMTANIEMKSLKSEAPLR